MFDKRGVITFDKEQITEEQVMDIGLEAGAEDIIEEDALWEVRVEPADMEAVRTAYSEAGFEPASAELSMIPQNTIDVDAVVGKKLLRLLDSLEENDDVQNVWANFDMSDEVMAELE